MVMTVRMRLFLAKVVKARMKMNEKKEDRADDSFAGAADDERWR